MTLRVNPASGSVDHYRQRLADAGIAAEPAGDLFPQALVLDEPRPVQVLPGFAEGDASVQDASAQLAAPLLLGHRAPQDLAPGETWAVLGDGARVLDACAAPGGKTAHLQELAGNRLDLLALDTDAKRLERSIDQIGLTFKFSNKPKGSDIFTAQFLPPRAERNAK